MTNTTNHPTDATTPDVSLEAFLEALGIILHEFVDSYDAEKHDEEAAVKLERAFHTVLVWRHRHRPTRNKKNNRLI
jgi:hypothetical protein